MKNLKNLILGLLVTIFISGNTFAQIDSIDLSIHTNSIVPPINILNDDIISTILEYTGPGAETHPLDTNVYNTLKYSVYLFKKIILFDNNINNHYFINYEDNNITPQINFCYLFVVNGYVYLFKKTSSSQISFIKFEKAPPAVGLDVIHTDNFSVFPNPTTDFINIKTDEWNVETIVMDMNGNIVIISDSKQIDVRDLPQGTYLVSVNNSKPKRIVKN